MTLASQVTALATRVATEIKSVRTSVAASRLLSVKDYGAKGDDATDDTAAIQAAMDACPEGGTVFFPVGKYRTTAPLYPKRGITLKGEAAPRWSYTFVPQSYIKIRSTFSGAAAIHLRDMELAGVAVEMGNVRLIDLCLDGSAQGPTPTVDGILATGQVRDVRLQNVSVRNFSNAGIHTLVYVRADTKSYFPRGWELSHVVADTCGNQGFSFNNLDDSYFTDCLAVGNKTDGFYLAGVGEDHLIGCRSVFNKNNGFHVTGSSFGSAVFSGCTTDRNEFNGVLVDATGKLPILFAGCSWRRDGRNGNGGGGGYAGFRASSATVPIVISAMNTMTGQDDDATGTMSPQYGMRVGSCTAVQITSGYLHGFTAALQNDGSNTNFYISSEVTYATGSANAPTISRFAAGPTIPSSEPPITGGTTAQYWRGDKSWQTLDKTAVGLPNVDNTSDANKPISSAQATVNAAKADLVGGVVPTSQIPALALTASVSVASQAAMLALTSAQVQPGDLAVRTDGAGTFILTATDPSVLANWRLLNAPTDAVVSVQGQVGTVVLAKGDIGLGSVDNTSDAAKPVSTAQQTALNAKEPSLPTGGTLSQFLAGDKSWQDLSTATAPPTLGLTSAAGTAATMAHSDHVHGITITPVNADAVPSGYPLGMSTFSINASQTGWPATLGQVITWRLQNQRTAQQFHDKTGLAWVRAENATDVWTAWTQLGGSAAAASVVSAAVFTASGALGTFVGGTRYYVLAAGTVTLTRASLGTAGSTGTTVALKKNGTTALTLTVASATNTNTSSTTVTVAAGDYLTVDVTAAGTGAADLTVQARIVET